MLEKSVSVDGIEVNYKVGDPSSPKASEGLREVTPLVILHGWGSSSDSWVKVGELIAQEGFRVLMPDLPGFGKTVAPKEVWGVEEYADFVAKFSETVGLQKFVLVGHSFGGQVAVQFAVSYGEKVEKLIFVAPAAVRYGPDWTARLMGQLSKIVWLLLYVSPPNFRNNVRHVLYRIMRRRDYFMAQGVMKSIFQKVIRQDLSLLFNSIKAPTFILWGTADKLTPAKHAIRMSKAMPQAKVEILENRGHNLHVEVPEKLAQFICSWLS